MRLDHTADARRAPQQVLRGAPDGTRLDGLVDVRIDVLVPGDLKGLAGTAQILTVRIQESGQPSVRLVTVRSR